MRAAVGCPQRSTGLDDLPGRATVVRTARSGQVDCAACRERRWLAGVRGWGSQHGMACTQPAAGGRAAHEDPNTSSDLHEGWGASLLVRDSHARAAGDGRVRRFGLPLDNERAVECTCTDEHYFGSDADCRGDQRRPPGRAALSPSLIPQPLLAAGNASHLDVFLNPNYQSTRLLA